MAEQFAAAGAKVAVIDAAGVCVASGGVPLEPEEETASSPPPVVLPFARRDLEQVVVVVGEAPERELDAVCGCHHAPPLANESIRIVR